MNLKALAFLAVAALGAGRACAVELVTNGGFETGDFTGWTLVGETDFSGVYQGPPQPHGGTFAAFFGPLGSGGAEQTLAANVGDTVHVSFWYLSEAGVTPNSMSVTLGSVAVFSTANITDTTYQDFEGDFVVADANPVLQFTFSDPPDYIDLDDVSVTAVPGPGTLGALTLGAAALLRRRRP